MHAIDPFVLLIFHRRRQISISLVVGGGSGSVSFSGGIPSGLLFAERSLRTVLLLCGYCCCLYYY